MISSFSIKCATTNTWCCGDAVLQRVEGALRSARPFYPFAFALDPLK